MDFDVLMNNSSCKGVYSSTTNKLTVKQGSTINQLINEHFKNTNTHSLRDELIQKGIIKNYEFIEDYEFNSPSQAAGVIDGCSTNGRVSWNTREGYNLNNLDTIDIKQTGLYDIVDDLIELFDIYKKQKLDKICKKMFDRINKLKNPSEDDYVLALLKEKNRLNDNEITLESLIEMQLDLWHEYQKTR